MQIRNLMQQNPSWWEANSFLASENIRRTLRNPKIHFRFGKEDRAVFAISGRRAIAQRDTAMNFG